MSIHLILSPMFAGKTTELLRLADSNQRSGFKVVYVKHQLDQKRHKTRIRTHNGETSPDNTLLSTELMAVYDQLTDHRVNVICIDEGQFFADLATVSQLLATKYGKKLIVAALNATYKRHVFPAVSQLLPYCEKIQLLTAVCSNSRNNIAQFTHRLHADNSSAQEVNAK